MIWSDCEQTEKSPIYHASTKEVKSYKWGAPLCAGGGFFVKFPPVFVLNVQIMALDLHVVLYLELVLFCLSVEQETARTPIQ